MIRKLVAAFVTILFAASLHSTAFAATINGVDLWKYKDEFKAGDVIRAEGVGGVPKNWDKNDSFAKTFARQAARIVALNDMAEDLGGVHVESDSTIVEFDIAHDWIKSTLSQNDKVFKLLEKNARVIDVKFLDHGDCKVTMKLILPANWKEYFGD